MAQTINDAMKELDDRLAALNMAHAYKRLEVSIAIAQSVTGFEYPEFMVSLTELIHELDEAGFKQQALSFVNKGMKLFHEALDNYLSSPEYMAQLEK